MRENAATCTSRKCCRNRTIARPLLRHVRARLPAQRTGDRVPAQGGRRRERAARAGVGGKRAQVRCGRRHRAATRARRAVSAQARAIRLRRARRRVPGTPRSSGGEAGRARSTRRVQPSRLAGGHARRGSRAVRSGLAARTRVACCRSRGVPPRRSRDRRHRDARRIVPRARRETHRGLPRRRRRARLRTRMAATARVQRVVRRQADPPPRAGDDSRGRAPRAGSAVPRRRQRPARGAVARTDGERGLADVGGVRALAGRAAPRRLRARHLRNDAESTARHPEQGVPGARVRRPGDHRRHAGRARAAPRR